MGKQATRIKDLMILEPYRADYEDLRGWEVVWLTQDPDDEFPGVRFFRDSAYTPTTSGPKGPYLESLVQMVDVYRYPRPEMVEVSLWTYTGWRFVSNRYPKLNLVEAYERAVNDCLIRLDSYESYHRDRLTYLSDASSMDNALQEGSINDALYFCYINGWQDGVDSSPMPTKSFLELGEAERVVYMRGHDRGVAAKMAEKKRALAEYKV